MGIYYLFTSLYQFNLYRLNFYLIFRFYHAIIYTFYISSISFKYPIFFKETQEEKKRNKNKQKKRRKDVVKMQLSKYNKTKYFLLYLFVI